ncbi:MAG: hypothetical protein QME96_12095 [Myxococcota bacterium]|nr:hypothetical protein [Myxococcota bacterium]
MSKRVLYAAATAALVASALATCSQDDGERCQLPMDCSSVVCCKCTGEAAEPAGDGICTASQESCDIRCRTGGGDADARVEADAETGAEAEFDRGRDAPTSDEAGGEAEGDALPEADDDGGDGNDDSLGEDAATETTD